MFFVPPETKIGRPEEKDRLLFAGCGIVPQPLLQGKGAAGVRPAGINTAALGRKERAGLFRVLRHAQQHVRKVAPGPQHRIHVAVEELVGGDPQTFFQADHIVGIEKQVQVAAAAVEAADARMAAEPERFPLPNADARQPIEVFRIQFFHGSTPSSSSISAMVIRIFRRGPSIC